MWVKHTGGAASGHSEPEAGMVYNNLGPFQRQFIFLLRVFKHAGDDFAGFGCRILNGIVDALNRGKI